jgi:NADH:ubiquinone oxidoreductase subunit F (NADH-binding)
MSALLQEYETPHVAGPRLLHGEGGTSLDHHLARYGPLPPVARRAAELVRVIEASGLTGRGGASFPSATKLRSVSRGRRTVVVANGAEGEPASAKDKILMIRNPHLVLDGLAAAAELVGAVESYVAVASDSHAAISALAAAAGERADRAPAEIVCVPDRFVTGEESAVVHWLNDGQATPTGRRPFERGVHGRPTLVQNVETLAHLALVVRYGAAWFRTAGTSDEPGTALATVLGAIRMPGVVELEVGTTFGDVFDRCGGLSDSIQAILVGGYFGSWIAPDLDVALSDEALRPRGASLGARTIVALPRAVCGLAETSRVVRYMAGESAGQCGPCVFGLAALADAFESIGVCDGSVDVALDRIPRLCAQIARRGACAHPDGTLGLVMSALDVFASEVEAHRSGRCTATSHASVLPA